ncbi:hypothetical protein V8C34DRAFT_285648 [Trichoderma compactum]
MTKRGRFASALHQTSIRSHHLVRLFSCIFTHALPRGTPQQLDCLRSNSSSRANTRRRGSLVDVDLCFFLLLPDHMSILVRCTTSACQPLLPLCSSCKLTSGCTSTSSFALVKPCLTQEDEHYSSWENRL